MSLKIKIKFFDLIFVFLSFLLFLIFFSDFRKEYNQRVIVLFPEIPVVYFSSGNFNFEISNSGEKVFTPVFFDTPRFTEIDSRITKRFDNCEDARVYNYQMSPTMLTFTIDARFKKNIDQCFKKLSADFKKKWEDAKGSKITFLNRSELLITNFSNNLAKKVLEPFDYILKNYNDINCKNFLESFSSKDEIPNPTVQSYLDVCGDKLKLIFAIENKTNIDQSKLDNLNSILLKYLNDKEIKNFEFKNNNFYFPVFLNIDLSTSKIQNKEILNTNIFNVMKAYGEIYPNEVGFIWEGSNKSINYDEISENSDKSIQLALLRSIVENYISREIEEGKPHTFSEFKDSELIILKSDIYELGSTRTFSTFGIYFTATFFSLFLVFLNKILINIIRYKFNERK